MATKCTSKKLLSVAIIAFGILSAAPYPVSAEDLSSLHPCAETPGAADCDPSRINSRGWQDSPYISLDGRRLYFFYAPWSFYTVMKQKPLKVGPPRPEMGYTQPENPWGPGNTFVSERRPDGHWSSPVRVPWDRQGGSCCARFNRDETAVYFPMDLPDGSGKNGIVHSERDVSGHWSDPVFIPVTIDPGGGRQDNPFLARDGNTLYWTSTRRGGFGGKDLWFSTRANDTWSAARNLGAAFNSDQTDDNIWISSDGNTAYFNRNETLMFSRKKDGIWSGAVPVPFETPVLAAEPSLTEDGLSMYMVVIDTDRNNLVIAVSHPLPDGQWSTPVPVD